MRSSKVASSNTSAGGKRWISASGEVIRTRAPVARFSRRSSADMRRPITSREGEERSYGRQSQGGSSTTSGTPPARSFIARAISSARRSPLAI